MGRIPYEIVQLEVDKIAQGIALSSDCYSNIYSWRLYFAFITSCGWTIEEFDKEMLRRIDANWDIISRRLCASLLN